MSNGGFGVAQIGGNRHDASAVNELPRAFTSALNDKRQDAAKGALLFFRQFMLGMTGQARIIDLFDLRLLRQPARQRQRAGRRARAAGRRQPGR